MYYVEACIQTVVYNLSFILVFFRIESSRSIKLVLLTAWLWSTLTSNLYVVRLGDELENHIKKRN